MVREGSGVNRRDPGRNVSATSRGGGRLRKWPQAGSPSRILKAASDYRSGLGLGAQHRAPVFLSQPSSTRPLLGEADPSLLQNSTCLVQEEPPPCPDGLRNERCRVCGGHLRGSSQGKCPFSLEETDAEVTAALPRPQWGSFCTWETQGPVGHRVLQLLRGCFQRRLLAF